MGQKEKSDLLIELVSIADELSGDEVNERWRHKVQLYVHICCASVQLQDQP